MSFAGRPRFLVLTVVAALLLGTGHARQSDRPPDPPGAKTPSETPAPDPEKAQPEPTTEEPDPDGPAPAPVSNEPWELADELLIPLARQAEVYREYAVRFTCLENARIAHYDESNEASRESMRRYSYLLERDATGSGLREYREVVKVRQKGRDVSATGRAADDEERFPPAYAWVFLFSRENQPFFMYRSLGERFEGFDWVHEIQFRGALPFTDGRDIRQWEGTVLMDAVTHAPVEIRAEPSAQSERIKAEFDRWSRSFNLIGVRLAPRPFGYRCRVTLGFRKDRLAFPTELRYDTFRAVGSQKFIPWMASVRLYDDYKFYQTSTEETPAKPVAQ